jgi:hypothetical protein
MTIKKFPKYKENLSMVTTDTDKFIFSYETKVAEVKDKYVRPLGYWSMTTSKHINYAAQQLGLPVLK